MIELHYWTTPNAHKITIFLEESGVPYHIIPVDISAGDQFKPQFLAISPNNRIPAIVDRNPTGRRVRGYSALPRRERRRIGSCRPIYEHA
ncbi:MAG TPA: glutathione S-transferase N-terminal domain-containing protein [Terriglobales bacterium]|nr:glutathione S-transferase N-terminal domain-containing protein [Terriglobales bacterium]